MAANNTLQVVFLLDITGSMGSQMEGVKQMVSTFCAVEREHVEVTIGTFTESSAGCFVSLSPPGLAAQQLVAYVQGITLCVPPNDPKHKIGSASCRERVCQSV